MSVRPWTFAVTAFQGLLRIPESRYQQFRAGSEPLPGDSTEVGHVVELLVELVQRRPVRVVYCAFVRYVLMNDGRRAAADVVSEEQATFGVIAGMVPDLSPTSNVRSIVPRLSRERLRTRHAWEPSGAELQAICEYVNTRSGKIIVRPERGRPSNV
jgi:hypothetical protein